MSVISQGAAGIFAIAFAVSIGCTRTPPEAELRAALTTLQASVEARDASALEAGLATDFVGPDGLDRAGTRRLAQIVFLRHRDIDAQLGPPRITIQDDHATVHFTAALLGGQGGALPDAANLYDLETAWRIDRGKWRLISAEWTPRL